MLIDVSQATPLSINPDFVMGNKLSWRSSSSDSSIYQSCCPSVFSEESFYLNYDQVLEEEYSKTKNFRYYENIPRRNQLESTWFYGIILFDYLIWNLLTCHRSISKDIKRREELFKTVSYMWDFRRQRMIIVVHSVVPWLGIFIFNFSSTISLSSPPVLKLH